MKNSSARFVCLVTSLACVMVSGSLLAFPNPDESKQGDWPRAVRNAKENFKMFSRMGSPGKRIESDKFFEAEAGCAAGAVAILSMNDFLVAAPSSIQIEYDVQPDTNVLVYLRRGFSDGRRFDFLCLISKSYDLKRVRLVGGFGSAPNPAEMDGIHFVYGGKSPAKGTQANKRDVAN